MDPVIVRLTPSQEIAGQGIVFDGDCAAMSADGETLAAEFESVLAVHHVAGGRWISLATIALSHWMPCPVSYHANRIVFTAKAGGLARTIPFRIFRGPVDAEALLVAAQPDPDKRWIDLLEDLTPDFYRPGSKETDEQGDRDFDYGAVAVSPDGKQIAMARVNHRNRDRVETLIGPLPQRRLAKGESLQLRVIAEGSPVAWISDGSRLLLAQPPLTVIDAKTGAAVYRFPRPAKFLGTLDRGNTIVYQEDKPEKCECLPGPDPVFALRLDGRPLEPKLPPDVTRVWESANGWVLVKGNVETRIVPPGGLYY